jgi:hypothetical protein
MNRKHYRIALVTSLVTGFCGVGLELIFPELLSEQLRKANELQAETAATWQLLAASIAGGVSFIWSLASVYGLYQFRAWAPKSALASSGLGIVAVALMGSVAQSGATSAFSMVASYLWGICILLPFIEPYSSWFAPVKATEHA